MEILPVLDFKQARNTVFEMLIDRKYKIIQPINVIEDINKLYTIIALLFVTANKNWF